MTISDQPLPDESPAHVGLGPVVGPLGRVATGGRNWEGFAADRKCDKDFWSTAQKEISKAYVSSQHS